ncbi:membrane-targeted effector domain-containing toxin [Pseudomonas sp. S3E12]|uniref:membrane-targeted effector domain-containing toxin n=1 Tax=Pseudomonas sp. S3E12 TaxID=1873126 RepID=UPI000ADD820D|nr:membrane-targeted effector domain-containing toxin [Pseudomonas sp. S3E12]
MQSILPVSIQQPQHFLPATPGDSQNQPSSGSQHATPAQTPRHNAANTELARVIAYKQNLRTLGQALTEIATRLGTSATPQAILGALKTTTIDIHPESFSSDAHTTVTLEAYIRSSGLSIPSRHDFLTVLAESVLSRAQEHHLGNFGGALSWPLPLSADGQRSLVNAARRFVDQHPNPSHIGSQTVLEYLNSNQPLPSVAARDPVKALETLLATPRAQAFGQALQTELNGIATNSSVNDYTLAAMNLLLDPQSTPPHANRVAGFDLAQQSHWGKPASAVFGHLSEYLSRTHRTTPEMAKVGAYLLLARKAPELLIKDLPANLTYGSPAWVSLSIAAATIEAQTPGKVPNMTFAQVMLKAKDAGQEDMAVTQQAQAAALRTWGVVNGVLSEDEAARYNTSDIEKVRSAFNLQADARVEASDQIETTFPSRKEIALAELKERFGEDLPFEEKLLTVKDNRQPFAQPLYDPNRAPAGRHSLLDIAMSGLHMYEWETQHPEIKTAIQGKSLKFDVNTVFNNDLKQAIEDRKEGITTAVKQMISQLPIDDRQKLEYGKLEFYQNHTYTLGMGFSGRTLTEKNHKLFIKSTGVKGQTVYEMDLKQGTVNRAPDTVLTQERERDANRLFPIEAFTPEDVPDTVFEQNKPAQDPLPVPNSFSSTRTQAIADAFVKHLDIDNEDVIKQAKGATTFDRQMETQSKLAEFFLDLIPLKSAIQNFVNGNYLDGAVDLGMDIFGFVTAGAGAAAKVAKVGSKAISATTKALKVTKILGTAVIGELNPLSGVGDLVQGGARLIGKGVDKIKALGDASDLTRAVSREHGPITRGTFKVADQTYEADTILSNGQRYAYDPVKMKPYGLPLEEFKPANGLGPQSPDVSKLPHRPGFAREHRYDPIGRHHHPNDGITKTDHLPEGEYVSSIKGASSDAHFTPSRKAATREKFNQEMSDFYRRMASGERPDRPLIPEINGEVRPSELLDTALDAADGLVFGEKHSEMASFQVLYDNLDTFKKKDVKKLYMEATFYDAQMKLVDDGIGFLGDGITQRFPSFKQLVKKFTDNGIEIMPLDHPYLTRHKDEREVFKKINREEQHVPRLNEFNYYAAQTIRQNSAGEKWIALMGNAHMNTSQGVPGVAELTGGIGVGVLKRNNPGPSVGMRNTDHAPNPELLIGPNDWPGDLQIFKQVKSPPQR